MSESLPQLVAPDKVSLLQGPFEYNNSMSVDTFFVLDHSGGPAAWPPNQHQVVV